MKSVLRFVGVVSESSGKLFSFLYLAVIVAICYEIASRYVFSAPTFWVQEFTEFCCGIAVIIGGAYALRERSHVRMEVLYNEFSPRRKALADALTFAFFLVFMIVLLRYSANFAWKSFLLRETSISAWGPPIWPAKMAVPVGAALLLLQGIGNFVRDVMTLIGREHVD